MNIEKNKTAQPEDTRIDAWWEQCSRGIKTLFAGIDAERASEYHYRIFWNRLDQSIRNDIYRYCQYRMRMLSLTDAEVADLLTAIVQELTDGELSERADIECLSDEQYGLCFYEEGKKIEERILNGNFE